MMYAGEAEREMIETDEKKERKSDRRVHPPSRTNRDREREKE